MEERLIKPVVTCLSAKAATGIGSTIDVADARHIVVALSADVNSTLTVKFQASVSAAAPTFSSAQSATNHWDYIGVYDLESGTFIAGDTGVALNNTTAAVNTRQYLVNADFLRHFNMEVTSYTDGAVTSTVTGALR